MIIQKEVCRLETKTGVMRCEVFRPVQEGAFGTVVFYSEIFQITAPIARTASYLAGQGFVVVVPEVFHDLNELGTVLGYDDEGKEKGNNDKFTKVLPAHDSDLEAIIQWVNQQSFCNQKVGAFGVCLGGHLSFRAGLNENVAACSCLYATDIHSKTMPHGDGVQTVELLDEIKAEMLIVWGRQDPHVPVEGRKALYEQFSDSTLNFTWFEVNGQHAFMRDEGDRYDPELSKQCLGLTVDLFNRTLR